MFKLNKFSIGGTAAIITSMGLIAGLGHGEDGKAAIIAGLLIIAIADNIADSLSIHIYKESEGANRKEILLATYGNFLARLLVVLTFVVIVAMAPVKSVVIISSVWGLALLTFLSYSIAQAKQTNTTREVIWHLVVAILVIIGSRLLGTMISNHAF